MAAARVEANLSVVGWHIRFARGADATATATPAARREMAETLATSRSWGRGRFLICGEPDEMAIQGCSAIDGGRFIFLDEVVRLLSGAHHGVIAPDVVRFAIQEIDGLYLTGMKNWHE